jgi:hypothetical protein
MGSSKFVKYLIIFVAVLFLIFIIGRIAGWFGGNKAVIVAVDKAQKRTIYEVITADRPFPFRPGMTATMDI